MPWLSVTLTVGAGSVEALSDALLDAGAMSVEVVDARAGTAREQALFGEPGRPEPVPWALSRVSALFEQHEDITARATAALRAAGLDPASRFDVQRIADRDWVRASQSQFQPVRVTPRLWVVPTWHTPPDPAAVNLIIDPGIAFGTGTHPSTRLCLAWLDANLRGGKTVLDYGCGSGILAIAAMKLGAARAAGYDIDTTALLAARHNAMQNRVEVQFESEDPAASTVYDIVLANILANPLQVLAPLLARATRGGGRIVLAGILEHQAEEVGAAYREWFRMDTTEREESWVLLSGIRQTDSAPAPP